MTLSSLAGLSGLELVHVKPCLPEAASFLEYMFLQATSLPVTQQTSVIILKVLRYTTLTDKGINYVDGEHEGLGVITNYY